MPKPFTLKEAIERVLETGEDEELSEYENELIDFKDGDDKSIILFVPPSNKQQCSSCLYPRVWLMTALQILKMKKKAPMQRIMIMLMM